ncbi:MAG TPA: hypothetical protein VFF65_13470 [Phycisphaerales bacterium]|nr:hypothetical protein [Phycisphaerales bacterium]
MIARADQAGLRLTGATAAAGASLPAGVTEADVARATALWAPRYAARGASLTRGDVVAMIVAVRSMGRLLAAGVPGK